MSRIFWDTNVFIYRLEGSDEHFRARKNELITSTLTLGEVLVKPLEARQRVLTHLLRKGSGESRVF